MFDYLNIAAAPVRPVLAALLRDRTTGRNIVWGTDSYAALNPACQPNAQITEDALLALDAFELQPRCMKAKAEQLSRTRSKAEVFTPAWICNMMNNACDADWFGAKAPFNISDGHSWLAVPDPIEFPLERDWRRYVDSRRLEISCGEAPFITSRYDAATGDTVPVSQRIGLLDRKLRVVAENAENATDWYKWARRAVESVYGYEYQGDNLLIARVNVFMTYVEHARLYLDAEPDPTALRAIAGVISWNFWQMNGLTGKVPYGEIEAGVESNHQMSFFESNPDDLKGYELPPEAVQKPCIIYDWRSRAPLLYNDLKWETMSHLRKENRYARGKGA